MVESKSSIIGTSACALAQVMQPTKAGDLCTGPRQAGIKAGKGDRSKPFGELPLLSVPLEVDFLSGSSQGTNRYWANTEVKKAAPKVAAIVQRVVSAGISGSPCPTHPPLPYARLYGPCTRPASRRPARDRAGQRRSGRRCPPPSRSVAKVFRKVCEVTQSRWRAARTVRHCLPVEVSRIRLEGGDPLAGAQSRPRGTPPSPKSRWPRQDWCGGT